MRKKLALMLTALTALSVITYPVMAADTPTLPNESSIVQPRYTNISYVGINFDRYGTIKSSVLMLNNLHYVVTVELRETNGTLVDSWTEEDTDVSASYDLESGVRYYAKVTVKVYNSSGRVIETATAKSSTVTAV